MFAYAARRNYGASYDCATDLYCPSGLTRRDPTSKDLRRSLLLLSVTQGFRESSFGSRDSLIKARASRDSVRVGGSSRGSKVDGGARRGLRVRRLAVPRVQINTQRATGYKYAEDARGRLHKLAGVRGNKTAGPHWPRNLNSKQPVLPEKNVHPFRFIGRGTWSLAASAAAPAVPSRPVFSSIGSECDFDVLAGIIDRLRPLRGFFSLRALGRNMRGIVPSRSPSVRLCQPGGWQLKYGWL